MAEDTQSARPTTDEIATTQDGRDITRGFVSPLMLELPDDSVLMQRGGGDYALYREVIRDDHVKSALQQRFHAVIARPFEVRPGGDKRIDKLAAKDLEAQIKKLRWDAITEKMLYGVFYGFAVGEALFGLDGTRVVLTDIKVRDRRRFGFDGAGRLRMKTMQKPDGERLPDRKFWHFATGADHDDAPYGLGLAHWLYWPVWLKRNGTRFWAIDLEKFGTPTAAGKFPPGTSATDQQKLLSALRAIQRDSAIIFPDGMTVEYLEAARNGTADHATFVAAMNAAILVITIGQTASTQGTPGKLGNDEEQGDVRADITQADADLVCMSFNSTIARWLTDWNFPGAAYPQVWRVMDDAEDLNQTAERDDRLSRVGYKPTLERVLKVYGEGYEPVAAAPAIDPIPAQFADAETPPTPTTMAARLADEAAPSLKAMLDQIALMAESAESLEQLRDWLLEAYGDLDTGDLVKVMEAGFAAANLAGRFEVSQDG